jgi:hypothetical protein
VPFCFFIYADDIQQYLFLKAAKVRFDRNFFIEINILNFQVEIAFTGRMKPVWNGL